MEEEMQTSLEAAGRNDESDEKAEEPNGATAPLISKSRVSPER
jgi:hypothetical protein